jgi:hypothetical protein
VRHGEKRGMKDESLHGHNGIQLLQKRCTYTAMVETTAHGYSSSTDQFELIRKNSNDLISYKKLFYGVSL